MSTPRRLGTLVGGTRYREPQTQEIRHSFDLLDLDAGLAEPARIPLDFLAHGFALHPARKEAALLEKRGPGGCYVDLEARAVLRTIAPKEGHHFYGHGAFSRDGEALFAVETDLGTRDGVITVRDPGTFAVLDAFPTYGKSPHDCVLIEDGRTLVITNGGGPLDASAEDALPCVSFVDVASRKLLERHVVPEPRVNAGHVALHGDRGFVVVSAPRDGLPDDDCGGVSLRAVGGALRYASAPEPIRQRMIGETLSVCVHAPTRTVVATHPHGHLLTFWNLDTGGLAAAFDLLNPRGVALTLDERYFAVSFGPSASLLLIETSPLRPVRERDPGARRFGGSHIYAWAG